MGGTYHNKYGCYTYNDDTTWCDWTNTATTYGRVGKYTVATTATSVWCDWTKYDPPKKLTAAEKAERKRQEDERQRVAAEQARLANIAWLEAQAVEKAAQERARKLFLEVLDTEQRQTFEKDKKFYLIGSDGERYEVDCTKHHQNVYQVDKEGKRKVGYCAYATGGVPLSDNHIVQKLLLETDAKAFLKVANSWRVAA